METLESKVYNLENKVDEILNILKNDVKPECAKMSTHINFIETVYDNVKYPLHLVCNKINNVRQLTLKHPEVEHNFQQEYTHKNVVVISDKINDNNNKNLKKTFHIVSTLFILGIGCYLKNIYKSQ